MRSIKEFLTPQIKQLMNKASEADRNFVETGEKDALGEYMHIKEFLIELKELIDRYDP